MTPIEIIALIIAAITAIKLVIILVNPSTWMNKVVKPIFSKPGLTMIVALILAAVVLYYLNQAGITIIEIFAVMAFMALLMALSFVAYSKEMLEMTTKLLKDKTILKRAWLAILVWIVLIIWVLYVLLV